MQCVEKGIFYLKKKNLGKQVFLPDKQFAFSLVLWASEIFFDLSAPGVVYHPCMIENGTEHGFSGPFKNILVILS